MDGDSPIENRQYIGVDWSNGEDYSCEVTYKIDILNDVFEITGVKYYVPNTTKATRAS